MNALLIIEAIKNIEAALTCTPEEAERACLGAAHIELTILLRQRGIFVGQTEPPGIVKLHEACKLTLLFHSATPWTHEKEQEWANGLTRILGPAISRHQQDERNPSNEATTRNLCNAVRAALNGTSCPSTDS